MPQNLLATTAGFNTAAIQASVPQPFMIDIEDDDYDGEVPVPMKKGPTNFDTLVRNVFKLPSVPKFNSNDTKEFNLLHNLGLTYSFANPQSLVGIEIEVENIKMINPNVPLKYWIVATDGSLRNEGREFKSKPIPLSCVAPALQQLLGTGGLNTDIDFSIRTSVHIHQDVRGMTLGQLLTLIFGYICVENLLFKFTGSNRKNSIYCVPISETEIMSHFNSLSSFVGNVRNIPNVWHKYTALNVAPIAQFGTIEYRHMPGTNNINKLLLWIDLLSHLKVWAYRTPLDMALRLMNQLNTTSSYYHFLTGVFGKLVSVLDTSTLLPDIERNVSLVRSASITNEFHQYARNTMDETSVFAKVFKITKTEFSKMDIEYQKRFSKFASQFINGIPITQAFDKFLRQVDHYLVHPLTRAEAEVIYNHYHAVCAG